MKSRDDPDAAAEAAKRAEQEIDNLSQEIRVIVKRSLLHYYRTNDIKAIFAFENRIQIEDDRIDGMC
jgi:hypothetical protein